MMRQIKPFAGKESQMQRFRNQKGFTLIELSIVLVIIGIILGAVMKGQELINSAKVKKLQNNYVSGLDALMWSYMDRKGRLPGDCDRDGSIEYNLPVAAPGAALFSANTDPTTDYCTTTATAETDPDRVFADLRQMEFLPRSIPNNQYALVNLFGTTSTVAVGFSTVGINYNCIAIYNIPAYAAQMLDVSIDGTEDGTLGRVRYGIDTAGTAAAWPTAKDTLVNVAYYFDRTP